MIRWRSKRLNGCVPAEPTRMPCSRAIPATYERSFRSSDPTSAGVWQTGVAISSTDCISSGWMLRLELVPSHSPEHRLDVLDEVERLGVEEHVLLLDPERVRARPRRSCGRARCRPAPKPLPVIDGG